MQQSPIIELSLIQLFKTEQILVCLSYCPRTRQCIGSIKKLAQPQKQQQQQHWLNGSSQCCCCCVVVGNPSVTLVQTAQGNL